MATPAQTLANRANALHSTGPRTEDGKRASSQNAVTTGLTSPSIFIRPEELAEFQQFRAGLHRELKPVGPSQFHHFCLILHAAWNIRQCMQLESEIQHRATATKGFRDALFDEGFNDKLERVYRYRKMHEATHRRASADLRQLQTEQLWRRNLEEDEMAADASVLTDTLKVKRAAVVLRTPQAASAPLPSVQPEPAAAAAPAPAASASAGPQPVAICARC